MGNGDREITDRNRILEIIRRCDCCRIGFKEEIGTYIVPMNFGMKENADGRVCLYFQGSKEGKKTELMKRQPVVGYELDRKRELGPSEASFGRSYLYQCVMGKGILSAVEDLEEKKEGLQLIVEHYTDRKEWNFSEAALERLLVLKLMITDWTCKEH